MELDENLIGTTIVLRSLRPSDIDFNYISWLSNPIVNHFLEVKHKIPNLVEQKELVSEKLLSCDELMLGIFVHEDLLIGSTIIRIEREKGVGEIGIMLGDTSFHGKGIGTQTLNLIIGWARDFGLRKLEAGAYFSNETSKRIFEKNGFYQENVFYRESNQLGSEPIKYIRLALYLNQSDQAEGNQK